MRILMFEPTRAAVRRIDNLHDRVAVPGHLPKDRDLRWDHLPDLVPGCLANRSGDGTSRIRRVAHPPVRDTRAVEIEVPDEKGHVNEVMIVASMECPRLRPGSHSGRNDPVRLRVDGDRGRKVERLSIGLEE